MRTVFYFLIVVAIYSCASPKQETKVMNYSYYGDTITDENAEDISRLAANLGDKESVQLKISGKIDEVCQKKGCWMTIAMDGQDPVRVTFKDYGFFVPKDASGKTAIMEGMAYRDTTTVDQLKHFAQDAGKTEAEIEKITQPEYALTFEASGVIIKND